MTPLLRSLFLLFFTLLSCCTFAQTNSWGFERGWQKKTRVPFRLINNLIIVEMQINSSSTLNFIVDTGLKSTLITELSHGDSLTLNHAKEIHLKGLGGTQPISALSTKGNTIRIGSLVGKEQNVLVLMDNIFHLSEKLGLKVHGIIGYELFKNHVVDIDYAGKRLIIYKKGEYKYKKRRRQFSAPIVWHRYKPYMNINVATNDSTAEQSMHMLVDTGSSDALWIFNDSYANGSIPEPNIRSYLGHGLSGEVHGYKARVSKAIFGRYELKRPIVSFPDSSELSIAMNYKRRNGSIGGEVLKRFRVVVDYPGSKITMRSNGMLRRPFFFNISGIELSTPYPGMPVFIVAEVRMGSIAEKVGVISGDQLIEVNSRNVSEFTIQKLQAMFSRKTRGYLSVKVKRGKRTHVFRFKLKPVI